MKRKANQMRKMRRTLKNKPRHKGKPSLQMLHQHLCAIFFNLLLVSKLSSLFTQESIKENQFLSLPQDKCMIYQPKNHSHFYPKIPSSTHPTRRGGFMSTLHSAPADNHPVSQLQDVKRLCFVTFMDLRSYREISYLWVESVEFLEH